MKGRGFIFSADAVLSLTVVIILFGAIASSQLAAPKGKEAGFARASAIASDAAMVGLHSGKKATELGLAESALAGKDYKCKKIVAIDFSKQGTFAGLLSERSYCEAVD